MRFVFYIFSVHGQILEKDPEYCETQPLGGSETAAVRMAEALRKLGHEVRIITDADRLEEGMCDVFVSVRDPRPLVKGLPGRVNYLWCHDDLGQAIIRCLEDRETAQAVYARCEGVIVLSHYQAHRWIEHLHLPAEKIFMSSNGIPIEKFAVDEASLRERKPRAYYSSVPWRGLALLVEAWPLIHQAVPEAELLIFSSLKVYGREESEEDRRLYDQARGLPGVIYRGSVGQRELREEIRGCRVLAYPCIFAETSCITAMEAMASGCVVVSTALGALPETAWKNPLIPIGDGWIRSWAFEVCYFLVNQPRYFDLACQNLAVSKFFGWSRVAQRWSMRMQMDLKMK